MEYLKTLRTLLKNPDAVIDTFVFEEQTKFQHPFFFGLVGVVFVTVLNSILIDFDPELYVGFIDTQSDQMSQLNYWIEYARMKTSTQFLPLFLFFLLIPSLTLPGLLFFREDIEGFYLNLILNSYIVGISIFALLLMIPVWFFDSSIIAEPVLRSYLPVIFVGILILYIYQKYFVTKYLSGWLRILSTYILGCVIFLILKSFTASIIGYFIFAVNRFLDIWMTA